MGAQESRKNWLVPRWAYAALLLVLVVIAAAGIWFVVQEGRAAKGEARESLETIARLKAEQVQSWRAERTLDATLLAENPFFRQGVADALQATASSNPAAFDRIEEVFRSLQRYGDYGDVLLVNGAGRILASVSGRTGEIHPDAQGVLATALSEHQTLLTDLHMGPGDLPVHLDVIAPLDLATVGAPQLRTALLLRVDAQVYLYPLIQSWPVASRSAETLLVRRDGDSVLFLSDLKFRADVALKQRIPLTRTDVPAVMAVLGQEGFVEGTDYRGVEVFSALRGIPESSWSIVAKIDQEEAMASNRLNAGLIIGTTVAFILLALVGATLLWNLGMTAQLKARLAAERALRAEKAFSDVLFEASSDTVFLFEPESGRPVRWNRRFSEVSGFSDEEIASMKAPGDFYEEDDLQAAAAAIDSILACGRGVVELSLVTRSRQSIPYEYSATTVLQEDGPTLLLSIGRDVSQRKAMEQEAREANARLARAVGSLQERNRQGAILGELREFLQACASSTEIGPVVARLMPRLIPGTGGALFLLKSSKTDLESVARWGGHPEELDDNLFAPDQCWGLRRGGAYLVDDPHDGLRCPHLVHSPLTSYGCIPLMAKGDVLGLLHVFRTPGEEKDLTNPLAMLEELSITLAELLSLSISNIRLREMLSNQAIRDPLTGLHNRPSCPTRSTGRSHAPAAGSPLSASSWPTLTISSVSTMSSVTRPATCSWPKWPGC